MQSPPHSGLCWPVKPSTSITEILGPPAAVQKGKQRNGRMLKFMLPWLLCCLVPVREPDESYLLPPVALQEGGTQTLLSGGPWHSGCLGL